MVLTFDTCLCDTIATDTLVEHALFGLCNIVVTWVAVGAHEISVVGTLGAVCGDACSGWASAQLQVT